MIETKISKETQTKAVLKGFTHKDREEVEYTTYDILMEEDGYRHDMPLIHKITLEITQGLLSQWLRVNHNLLLDINFSFQKQKWWFYISRIPESRKEMTDLVWYDTYEEAFEGGLKASLDLV